MIESLSPRSPDALMEVIRLYRADTRGDKVDLGIGTYRDENGHTPVMAAVKAAESLLLETQTTKAYLSPAGDPAFVEQLKRLSLPRAVSDSFAVAGVQTPGGTGAFRLGVELVKAATPRAKFLLGLPSWPNHLPILDTVGVPVVTYDHYDLSEGRLSFESVANAFATAVPGDVVILQAGCHNPSGADFTLPQWDILADIIRERRLVPFIDLAYHGMAFGLEDDLEGTRRVLEATEEALLAISCSKSFGLYRDRVGALLVLTTSPQRSAQAQAQLEHDARLLWSMPPNHGAGVVRLILESSELAEMWKAELEGMRTRVRALRVALRRGVCDSRFAPAFGAERQGMFALLPICAEGIRSLREQQGIYLATNGRMNIAGLRDEEVTKFVAALKLFN